MELFVGLVGVAAAVVAVLLYSYTRPTRTRTSNVGNELPAVSLNRRVRPPLRHGSPEARAADEARYLTEVRLHHRAAFERDRKNAYLAGSKTYIWRTCADGNVCALCSRKNGKRFRWDVQPDQGHPGACLSCTLGFCRCFAEPVLPRL